MRGVAVIPRRALAWAVISLASPGLLAGCDSEEPGAIAARERASDPASPHYMLEGKAFQLVDGNYLDADGVVTLAESATGDMNADGHDDIFAVLRLDSDGSGVFYYVNALLNDGQGGWRHAGTDFIGDRIELEYVSIYQSGSTGPGTDVPIHPADYGQAVVGFSAHAGNEALAEAPSFFITRHWLVEQGRLVARGDY